MTTHITNMEIKNYRGIKHLQLDDWGLINIIVGKNGAGKTSVLEAIDLLSNVSPDLHRVLGKWRGINGAAQQIRTAFHRLDFANNIELVTDNRKLTIEALPYEESNSIIRRYPVPETGNGASAVLGQLHGVKHKYQVDAETVEWSMALHGDHFHVGNPSAIPNQLGAFFIHSRRPNSISETAKMLSEVQRGAGDTEKWLQSTMSEIDPNCLRVRLDYSQESIDVVVDMDWGDSIPLAATGDGFNRLALMFTGGLIKQTRFIIVDDVDSGLHHGAMLTVWRALIRFAKKYNKQVFCSTHDDEMLTTTLEAFQDDKDALRIYRVTKNGEETVATKYDYDLYADTKNFGFDAR